MIGERARDCVRSAAGAGHRLAFAVATDQGAFQAQWIPLGREINELIRSGQRSAATMALANYLDVSERTTIDIVNADAALTGPVRK